MFSFGIAGFPFSLSTHSQTRTAVNVDVVGLIVVVSLLVVVRLLVVVFLRFEVVLRLDVVLCLVVLMTGGALAGQERGAALSAHWATGGAGQSCKARRKAQHITPRCPKRPKIPTRGGSYSQ